MPVGAGILKILKPSISLGFMKEWAKNRRFPEGVFKFFYYYFLPVPDFGELAVKGSYAWSLPAHLFFLNYIFKNK